MAISMLFSAQYSPHNKFCQNWMRAQKLKIFTIVRFWLAGLWNGQKMAFWNAWHALRSMDLCWWHWQIPKCPKCLSRPFLWRFQTFIFELRYGIGDKKFFVTCLKAIFGGNKLIKSLKSCSIELRMTLSSWSNCFEEKKRWRWHL